MEEIDIIDLVGDANSRAAVRKYIKDPYNPVESLSDTSFQRRYRLPKQGFMVLLGEIAHTIETSPTYGGIPSLLKLTTYLRFVGCGCFQIVAGDTLQISQSSVCRIIKQVSYAIASKSRQYINWTEDTARADVQRKFYNVAGIPGIVGAIDCTHIRIQSVGGAEAERFRNRKGYFSINVQAVCDSDLVFRNVVPRWHGSVHDSRIFDNSILRSRFENNEIGGFLIGDQGYPLRSYLITPFREPRNDQERRFNIAFVKTRLSIERSFGVLKRIFSCLKTGLRTEVSTTIEVIISCFVLYNFLRMRKLIDSESYSIDDVESSDDFTNISTSGLQFTRGSALRAAIVENYF